MKEDKISRYVSRYDIRKSKAGQGSIKNRISDGMAFDDECVDLLFAISHTEKKDIAEWLEDPVEEIVKAPADLRQVHLDAVIAKLIDKAAAYCRFARMGMKHIKGLQQIGQEDLTEYLQWWAKTNIMEATVVGALEELQDSWGISADHAKLEKALRNYPDPAFMATVLSYIDKRDLHAEGSAGNLDSGNFTLDADSTKWFRTELTEEQLLRLLELLKRVPDKSMLCKKRWPLAFISKDTGKEDWLDLFRPRRGNRQVRWTMTTKQGNIGKKPLRDLMTLLCADMDDVTEDMLNSNFVIVYEGNDIEEPFDKHNMRDQKDRYGECVSSFHDYFKQLIDEAKG